MRIGKIKLINFKHIDSLFLDFTDKDLIVLDGPNGFGKTTIFDAIELVLTGKISRIKNTIDGRLGYRDILLSKNNSIDTEVTIEFLDEEGKSIVISKSLDSKKRMTDSEKRPDNWDIFDTYQLSSISEKSPSSRELISQENVSNILNVRNIGRYFNLFYYIQQEENTMFLKRTAKERMDEISQLFDTLNEEREQEKISSIQKNIDSEIRNISKKGGLLEEKNKILSSLKENLKSNLEIEEVEYFQLIEGNNIKEWDRPIDSITASIREKYLNDLTKIYTLVEQREDFTATEFNNQIYRYSSNDKTIENTIQFYNSLDKFAYLRELKQKEVFLKNTLKYISIEQLKKDLDSSIFIQLLNKTQINFNFIEVDATIENLRDYRTRISGVSELINELKDSRVILLNTFENINSIRKDECPLCGAKHDSYEELIRKIDEKTIAFSNMLDKDTKIFNEVLDDLYINHINKIIDDIQNHLNDLEKTIDEKFYARYLEVVKSKEEISSFVKWLNSLEIDIKPYLNNKFILDSDVQDKVKIIIEIILSKTKSINSSYSRHDLNQKTFATLFNSHPESIFNIRIEDVQSKINYINQQYYRSETNQIQRVLKEIELLNKKLHMLESVSNKLADIKKIYEKQIMKHWSTIINDIEILFYIYSGKIIQDFQRGCGLFIHINENYGQKSIRFVSSETEHDAINYLSSGQLSGLVLSFTFALNKVYGDASLPIILIDDPVQTMDEINIASFTELLRNEFNDKQIILSTHEENISRYIRYKFDKYNLDTHKLNIKNVTS